MELFRGKKSTFKFDFKCKLDNQPPYFIKVWRCDLREEGHDKCFVVSELSLILGPEAANQSLATRVHVQGRDQTEHSLAVDLVGC